MIELKLKNRKGSFHVNSKEVKDILAERQDIGYLQDISNSINQENIMVFDCELSEKVFSRAEILEAIDEFMSAFGMKNCYICVDRNDLYSIEAYNKYINAFLNICMVHSNKKFKDSTCVFYSVEEILAIHKAISLDYMYDNTILTINNGKPNNLFIIKI